MATRPSYDDVSSLTASEREVLSLMALGLSNAEIATHRDVAIGTVKVQVSSVLVKLGVRNRTEAVVALMNADRRSA